MRYPRLLILFPLVAVSAFAQAAPAVASDATTDYKQVAILVRQQRDAAQSALADDELRIAILTQQLKEAQDKLAAATAKPDAPKKK